MNTIIFDFDGTIADTQSTITETVARTLAALELPPVARESIRELIGLPLRDTFIRITGIGDGPIITKATETYRILFEETAPRDVKLFPHVAETLQAFHSRGLTMAIASSRGTASLISLAGQLGIYPWLSYICGEEAVAAKKPAPDMVTHILGKLGRRPSEALVVGDTWFDIAMGRDAGCRTCGVTYGNHSAQLLRAHNADHIIDDFADLTDIVTGYSD